MHYFHEQARQSAQESSGLIRHEHSQNQYEDDKVCHRLRGSTDHLQDYVEDDNQENELDWIYVHFSSQLWLKFRLGSRLSEQRLRVPMLFAKQRLLLLPLPVSD